MIFYRCVNGHRYGVNRSSSHCMECGASVSSVWAIPFKIPGFAHTCEIVRNGLSDTSAIVVKHRGEIVAMMQVGKCDSSIVYKADKHGVVRLHVDRRPVDDTQLFYDADNAFTRQLAMV